MSFLVWVYTSQDFAQTQQNFARSHDRVIVTFRNSEYAFYSMHFADIFYVCPELYYSDVYILFDSQKCNEYF